MGGVQGSRVGWHLLGTAAMTRSGFSNSNHAGPTVFVGGLRDRPGCSPGSPPVSLCNDRCGSTAG